MKITDDRARDLLRWLDDMAGDHTLLFDEMARYRARPYPAGGPRR